MARTPDQDLYSGLIRLHILHHAGERPVYGLWIIEELARHGYRLSAGTIYPLLHRLERRGLLRSTPQRVGRRTRRLYRITPAGLRALAAARQKVKELFGELFEAEWQPAFGNDGQRQRTVRRNVPRSTPARSTPRKRTGRARRRVAGL